MPRFFVAKDAICETPDSAIITVRGDDANHITRVLRMKPGEGVTVCDTDGIEYETVVVSLGSEVTLSISSTRRSQNEPPYRATVYQALVKGDRFDTVLQKATELGVYDIVPVITARCMVKLTPADYAKKVERWQRIAYEAAKQCGRARIPVVHTPVHLKDALRDTAQNDLPLFCYEGEGTQPLAVHCRSCEAPETIAIFIGPEGGYEPDEAALAAELGLCMTGLGHRILRTETAAPHVLSCLSYQYE